MRTRSKSLELPDESVRELNLEITPLGAISEADATRLLGGIIRQALTDGMSGVSFGYEEEGPFLRYFNRRGADGLAQWSMEPIPLPCFPYLLKSLVSLTEFFPEIPLRGSIALKNAEFPTLTIEFPRINEVRITWDVEDGTGLR